jgi:hypothetical protein
MARFSFIFLQRSCGGVKKHTESNLHVLLVLVKLISLFVICESMEKGRERDFGLKVKIVFLFSFLTRLIAIDIKHAQTQKTT